MQLDTKPWYKQFWPWVIISIPALTVVAGIITIVLAVKTQDGLVKDDYYKDGLAINQSLERDRVAHDQGITADVLISPEGDKAELRLTANDSPESLKLKLMHATLSNLDQDVSLEQAAPGIYRGVITPLQAGKWYVEVAPADLKWRLSGDFGDTSIKFLQLRPE